MRGRGLKKKFRGGKEVILDLKKKKKEKKLSQQPSRIRVWPTEKCLGTLSSGRAWRAPC
jgi:hypothetical protein